MKKKGTKCAVKKATSLVLAMSLAFSGASAFCKGSDVKAAKSGKTATSQAKLEDSGLDYDYARALQYSMYLYDANMCGEEVNENTKLAWRGDCHTCDSQVPLQPMDEKENGTNLSQEFIDKNKEILDPDSDGYVDVSGGFHDAGDHVKFGMPENYSAATLGWGYYEFKDSYTSLGQDSHIETLLRYFNDYLMKCTFRDADGKVIAHCYQVGDGDIDHDYWKSPEADTMARPAYFLTADKPQTDYVVSAAASLTINYLNFKEKDPEYAKKSLDYAKALWEFANSNEKQLSDNADGPKKYYYSNKWEDDYCWAGAWLYKATKDEEYLEQIMPVIDYYAPSGWAYCWNDTWSGALTILGEIDMENPELDLQNMYRKAQNKTQYEDADFWKQIEKAIDTWMTHYTTPGGYAFLNQWGSARYNTAMQYVTLVYEKYHKGSTPSKYAEWAESQMKYLMGNNPLDRCYIVGYNEKSAKYPHHRAASGLLSAEDTREQRHVLYGALVGGPGGKDEHIDKTSDYTYNEVTIDYNAAFVGACAGLYEFFGTDDMAVTENFPPAESENGGEDGGNDYWVEAFAVNDLHDDGAGVTKVSMKVMTNASDARKDISVRYFFNADEISDVKNVDVKELYDQANAEESPADGVISGPFKYEGAENVYYFEVKWDGYAIANSGKKYQCLAGMYYGDKWDPTNDYSFQGLPVLGDSDMFGDGNEVRTSNICVYSSGSLVGGVEPDGTTPSSEDISTTAEPGKTTAQPTTTQSPVTTESTNPTTTQEPTRPTTTQSPSRPTTESTNPTTTQEPTRPTTTQSPSRPTTESTRPTTTQEPTRPTTTQSPSRPTTESTRPTTTQEPTRPTTTQSPSRPTTESTNPTTTQEPTRPTTTQSPSRPTTEPTDPTTTQETAQPTTTDSATTTAEPVTTENDNKVSVEGIRLSDESITIKKDESYVLTAQIEPSNATNKNIEWKSENSNIACVSKNGKVIGVAEGETYIIGITKDGNRKAYCKVTVVNSSDTLNGNVVNDSNATIKPSGSAILKIILDKEEMILKPGDSSILNATVEPADAVDKTMNYATSDARVALVSNDGVITAVAPGIAVITVTSQNGISKQVTVKVNPLKVKSVKKKISKAKVKLTWKKQKNVTGYKVYRYNKKSKKYKLYKVTKKNTVSLSKLKKNQTYKFKVAAYKKCDSIELKGTTSKAVKVKRK